MKVLAVDRWSDRAHSEMFIGLHRAGVEVEVLCEPNSVARYAEAGVPVAALSIRRRLDVPAIRALRRRLARARPDILHLLDRRTLRNGLLAAFGIDVKVVTYRGVVGTPFSDPSNWITYLHPRVDRIVCVSEAVREDLVRRRGPLPGMAPERAVTIHKGYEPDWVSAPPADLRAFSIPPNATVVGFLANLRGGRGKGTELLIEAASRVDPALGVYYLLVGRGTDGPRLGARIAASPAADRFRAAGYRADGPELMAACDLMTLPSSSEGLPRAVMESMARGVPPIVTPTGAAELVEHGVSGLVVPHDDPPALAAAIARLATDLDARARMGAAARARIARRFSMERMIRRMRRLYDELV